MSKRTTTLRVTVVAIVAALVLAACGGGGGSTSAPIPDDADYNAVDVGFAQGMIPHHGQAVTMSVIAEDRSSDPAVVALAKQIAGAQEAEIEEMTDWLKARDRTVPDRDAGMDMDMGEGSGFEGMMMDGMLSDDDLQRLENAEGAEFDELYLEFMLQHHEGAIDMAEAEREGGKNAQLKDLAQRIIDTQQAEIEEINALLDKR
jgi:uncharacterized protein (DUF305 family)